MRFIYTVNFHTSWAQANIEKNARRFSPRCDTLDNWMGQTITQQEVDSK